jgi:hypothetical protein
MFWAVAAQCSTIILVTGPVSSNAAAASPDPFGGYDYVAASWTQTVGYNNVGISFFGDAVFASASGVAYLTTSSGPGTTIADQVASIAFNVPFGPASTQVQLFSGLDLPAGAYYLTIAADPGDEIGWNVTTSPTIETGAGASVNPGMGCFNGSSPSPYPPGTTGSCVADTLLFAVTGNASVPEPGTFSMLAVLAVAALLLRRKLNGF